MTHADKRTRSVFSDLSRKATTSMSLVKGLTPMPLSLEAAVYHHLALPTLARLFVLSKKMKTRVQWFLESQYNGVIDTGVYSLANKDCFEFLSGLKGVRGLELRAPCDVTNHALQLSLLDKHQASLRRLELNSHHMVCAASSIQYPRLSVLGIHLNKHPNVVVDAMVMASVDFAIINLFRRHSDTITDLDLRVDDAFYESKGTFIAIFLSRTGFSRIHIKPPT